jgi:hypothetical protein
MEIFKRTNMKKYVLIVLSSIIGFFILYEFAYKPYVWQKTMQRNEHKLHLGSYIFTTQMENNGSQSYERGYTIFKVTNINNDYVRLAVVRKFYTTKKASDGYFSAPEHFYEEAKKTISDLIVTAVLSEDIYDNNDLFLTDSLLIKYPNLAKSRLYVEDVSNNILPTKDSPIYGDKDSYFSLVYSKNEIITNAQLVPYVYGNSMNVDVELMPQYSRNIEYIINPK